MSSNFQVKRFWAVTAVTVMLSMIAVAGMNYYAAPALAQEESAPAETVADSAAHAADTAAAAEAAAAGAEEQKAPARKGGGPMSGLVELFRKGSTFMWPLLFCSVLAVGVIIERLISLQKASINTRKFMDELISSLGKGGLEAAKETCQKTRGPIAAIMHAGLMRADKGSEAVEKAIVSTGTIEMSFLERGLVILASIANIAPMIGFLGTVSGMIHAFEAIAAAEQVSAKLVATGISEALITTATGLLIAIPVQAMNNYFVSRIDRMIIEMEEASMELIDALTEMEAGRAA